MNLPQGLSAFLPVRRWRYGLIGAREFSKHIITGAVIIVAVMLDAMRGGMIERIRRLRKP